MSDTTRPTTDLLTQHVTWLRGLAYHLVRDADAADDLAQETVVRALQRPPTEAPRLRSWLAVVLRNLVSERHRATGHREAREKRSAKPDRLPPTDELVARLEIQRQLADAIAALDEPFRTAVLLRFYEGLSPRQIAARLGVPVATVKSRIGRGLERLRGRLDESYGDRRAWVCVLVPLAARPPVPIPATPTLGGFAVNVKIWLGAGAALAACAFVFFWPSSDGGEGPAPTASAGLPDARSPSRSSRGGGLAGSNPIRARDDGSQAGAETAPSTDDAALRVVQGRALDSSGRAVPSLAISSGPDSDPVLTTTDGSFAFETRATSLDLAAADPQWVTVRTGLWRARSTVPPVVIAARAIAAAGSRRLGGRAHASHP